MVSFIIVLKFSTGSEPLITYTCFLPVPWMDHFSHPPPLVCCKIIVMKARKIIKCKIHQTLALISLICTHVQEMAGMFVPVAARYVKKSFCQEKESLSVFLGFSFPLISIVTRIGSVRFLKLASCPTQIDYKGSEGQLRSAP